MGEFELIARYFFRPIDDPSVLIGPGDDAALVVAREPLAISTDTLVAGVHFIKTIDPARLAVRTLAVNLSDMAAMGARPRWFTLALTVPGVDGDWLEAFSSGLHECAAQYDVTLIGGDVTAGPLCLTVQIIAEVGAAQALRRSGAASGDGVFVTGTLGDAAAGLAIARARGAASPDEQYLLDRYETPVPRIAAGMALRDFATAAIDVSDGLVADLARVCAASGVGAQIDIDRLPMSAALRRCVPAELATQYALGGGDDYEICFTAPLRVREPLERALQGADIGVTLIGQCTDGARVECLRDGRPVTITEKGYEHFR